MEEKDPIVLLLNQMASELYTEVVLNDDSTEFWKKAQDYIFENSLLSFREGITSLKKGLETDGDMYNYMTSMIFRTFAQPYTSAALEQFVKGFDLVANDAVLGGFSYTASELSKVEQLLLFFVVHRDRITIAFFENDEKIANKQKAQKKKR